MRYVQSNQPSRLMKKDQPTSKSQKQGTKKESASGSQKQDETKFAQASRMAMEQQQQNLLRKHREMLEAGMEAEDLIRMSEE